MASTIEILTERGNLDLLKGTEEDFYVTRQIHDLHDFETKNADFTKSIKIPATPNNIDLLDAFLGAATNLSSTIPCQVIMDGIVIAPAAKLLLIASTVSNAEATYEVVIFYGNFNLFDSITEGDLSDINWADLAYSNTAQVYVNESQNTTDLVTPLCDWVSRDSGAILESPSVAPTTAFEINAMGFFIYAKEIIRRILFQSGFTLVVSPDVPADYNTIALACPVDKFINISDRGQLNFSSTVQKSALQVDQTENGTTARATFADVQSDALGQWQAGTNEWLIQNTGELKIDVQGFYTIVNGSNNLPPSRFDIYQNLVLVGSLDLSQLDVANVEFFFTTTINAIATDLIYVEIVAQAGGVNDVVTMEWQTIFRISTPGNDVDRNVQPSEWIPQIGKSDFIANILKLFNLVIQTDDITKEVTISPFNDVFTGAEQDLTNQIDAGFNEIETRISLDSLGQDSWFKWIEDDLLRRDVNEVIKFDNQILNKETTVIQMDFSACDNSLLHFDTATDTFLKAKIPLAEIETNSENITTARITIDVNGNFTLTNVATAFGIGDWISINAVRQYYRVVSKTDGVTGRVQTPIRAADIDVSIAVYEIKKPSAATFEPRLAIIRSDGGEDLYFAQNGSPEPSSNTRVPFVTASLTANWMDSLKWDQIVNTHYKSILDALQAPEVITAWFNIPTGQFVGLDFLRPVYMANFNAFYYLNKINQFKPGRKVQLELIRISNFQ